MLQSFTFLAYFKWNTLYFNKQLCNQMKHFQKSCISVKHKSSFLPYYYSCLTLVRYNVHYRIGAQQNTERKKEATVPLLFFWLDYSERLTRSSRALSYLCYLMQTGVTFCVSYRHKSTAITV